MVFIADDLGLNAQVNEAILHVHTEGALHGAALMLGQPATDEGVELAKKNSSLLVGWHLHLCDSKPLTCASWPWGSSPAKAGWAMGASESARELARKEIHAQWEAFQSTGLNCAFINTHHHLHVHPFVRRELEAIIPQTFTGWHRGGHFRFFGHGLASDQLGLRLAGATFKLRGSDGSLCRVADTVWGVDRLFAMRADEIQKTIAGLPDGLHEFIFHPRSLKADADFEALLSLRANQT